jgi:hypothetical protein
MAIFADCSAAHWNLLTDMRLEHLNMRAKNAEGKLPSPWKEFLAELDSRLEEPLELHCIGGFVLQYRSL